MARTTGGEIDEQERSQTVGGGIEYGFLKDLVGFQLRFAAIAIYRDFKAALAGHEITQHQHGVLQIVALNPASTPAQIAEALGTDRPTMVDIIRKLEDRGLLRRQKSTLDGRRAELFLSDEGAGFLGEVNHKIREHEARITADMTEAELQTLMSLLRRIHDQGF